MMGITSARFKESFLSHPAAHPGARASPHPDPIPTLPTGGEGTWPPCSPPALPLTVPPPGWRFAARPGWPCRPAAGTSRPGRTPAPAAGRSPAAAAAPPPWQRQMAAGGRPPLGSKSPGAVREMAPPAPRGAPGRPLGRQGRDSVGFPQWVLSGCCWQGRWAALPITAQPRPPQGNGELLSWVRVLAPVASPACQLQPPREPNTSHRPDIQADTRLSG